MAAKVSYFKIGLFVVVASALLVVGVVILGAGAFLRKKVMVETYINESVQGLDVGSPVKYRGVQIGNVQKIDFVHNEYMEISAREPHIRYVLIRCVIYPDMLGGPSGQDLRPFLHMEVRRGLRVRLAAQGITGMAYLEVDYEDPERNPPLEITWEPDTIYIPSVLSLTEQVGQVLDEAMQKWEETDLQTLLAHAETFLETSNRALENVRLGDLQSRAESLLDELRGTNRRLDDLLGQPELDSLPTDASATAAAARRIAEQSEDHVAQILADLSRASVDLKEVTQRLDGFVAPRGEGSSAPLDDLSRTLASLQTVSAELPRTVGRLNTTLRRLDRLISSQEDAIVSIVENLRQITEDLKDMSENARQYPSLIFFGEPPAPLEPAK